MSAMIFRRLAAAVAALVISSGIAFAQSKVTLAIGGASCLCYLPTMLAKQLGEFQKAGVNVDVVEFKGGSESLKAVMGGSADVASGYFDHCVNLAAKGQHLQSFVVYDRFPGFALVVSPKHTNEIKSVKDLANKKVGVSAPGSSTDFFLKYMLHKFGVDPNSVGVIGVGLGASAIAAMEQGQIDAAIMLDPAVTVLAGKYNDLQILSDTRSQKDTLAVFGGEYPGGALYAQANWVAGSSEGSARHDHCDRVHAQVDPLAHAGRDRRQDAAGICRQGQGGLHRRAQEHAADVFAGPASWTRKAPPPCSPCSRNPRRDVAKANIDLSKTYTNKYVEAAGKGM